MRVITFVRHGQSQSNVGGVTMEHHAIPLTDAGQAQARALVELLPQKPSKVLVSPFERAQHTAAPYCAALGLETQTLNELKEFETFDPDLMQDMDGKQRRPLVDEYWSKAEPGLRMGKRAETFTEFAQRVNSFRLETLPQLPDGSVVFGHGMWTALLFWRVMGFTDYDNFAMKGFRRFQLGFPMPNGATYRLQEIASGIWRIKAEENIMRRMADFTA